MRHGVAQSPSQKRTSIIGPVLVVGLLIVVGAIAYKYMAGPHRDNLPPGAPVAPSTPQTTPIPDAPPREAAENSAGQTAPAETLPVRQAASPSVVAQAPPPAADPKTLLATLLAFDGKTPLDADTAQKWKDALQQLIRQGPSSVPALRDFLTQNKDVNFKDTPAADLLGYPSLRTALLNALGQIGGADATSTLVDTLQTSVFPSDLATISTILEQQAPGRYQQDVLTAVRTQFTAAAQDQLGDADVGPLYKLLGTAAASGTEILSELSQHADKWPYYAAVEMAALPNGAGVPSLVQLAQNNSSGGQSAAVESLAQMAPDNPVAMEALLSLVRQGQLPDGILSQMGPYLAGRENELDPATIPPGTPTQALHVSNGNEDFVAADLMNSLTPAQINQRLALIDQILQTLPPGDTLSQNALQQQRSLLAGHLPK
jgi:hypothetical protein